jgi:predicted Zn-ribbon and HTH transcriptional regulator
MAHGTSKPKPEDVPAATQTARQRIAELLRAEELTTHEISQRASVQEREVAEHLRHLELTLRQSGERLHTSSPHCIQCGFSFDGREKHSRPSRCPRCKSERLSRPRFRITA